MIRKLSAVDRPMFRSAAFALLLAPALAAAQAGTMSEEGMAPAMGQAYGPGWGMGPGMMMGPGGGMMGGPGMGGMGMMGCPMMGGMMGPGMMGGMGMGPGMGMMGGGMMGPGMMMGPGGMGPGMGMGMGPGMMGGMGMGPLAMLDLTDDQQKRIAKIQEDVRKRHWNTQGKILEEQARLSELYAAEKPDPKQVSQVYGNIAKLQQEILEANLQAQNLMLDVLTKEQRDQLAQWRRGMARGPMGGRGPGPGRGMGSGMMHRGTPPAGGSSGTQ